MITSVDHYPKIILKRHEKKIFGGYYLPHGIMGCLLRSYEKGLYRWGAVMVVPQLLFPLMVGFCMDGKLLVRYQSKSFYCYTIFSERYLNIV